MKADNPFSLTFGKKPNQYISRYDNMMEIINAFTSENAICQTYLISGIRGSGKTVLMTSVAKELAATGEWYVADLNSTQDLLEDLVYRLADACGRKDGLSETGMNVSVAGFGLGFSGKREEKDSVGKIEALLEYARKKGKKVLITIDEVMNNSSMAVFASQFQIFVRKDYPVYLIMTGLYENIYAIQNNPSLTFLLRSPKIFMNPLSLLQISEHYRQVFEINKNEANQLAAYTKGYAFAFQALGFLYWEYRGERKEQDIIRELEHLLDEFAYRKIWESLSGQDKNIVLFLADSGKCQVKYLRESLQMTSGTFSKYRERLMYKGLIRSPERGMVELTLPRFGDLAKEYAQWNEDNL
jgi:AAA+ ATPase superfamily predicted ATPase